MNVGHVARTLRAGAALAGVLWAAPALAQEPQPVDAGAPEARPHDAGAEGPITGPATVDVEALEEGTAAGGEVDPKYAPVLRHDDAGDGGFVVADPPAGIPAADTPGIFSPGGALGGLGEVLDAMELKLGGNVLASIQGRVTDASAGGFWNRVHQPPGISRYETTLNLRVEAAMGRFRGVADIDLDVLGYGDDRTLAFESLSMRQQQFPVRFEAHALYVEGTDLLIDGLDVRFGQQVVQWGVADQFNPTNTINPEDLENVLRFGYQAANLMLRVDYAFLDTWRVTGVVVPVFRPAVLPRSAIAGAAAVDRIPFIDESTRLLLHAEREYAELLGDRTVVSNLDVQLPPFDVRNFQYALRVGGVLFGQDVGLSYYYGRTDIPQPIRQHVSQNFAVDCSGVPDTACIESLLETEVTLAYPRMHVAGLNLAGELPLGIGYRVELGVYVPQRRRGRILQEDLRVLRSDFVDRPAGEYPYVTPDGGRPVVIPDTPYAKWTIGFDYTFTRWLYGNVMWVHGFVDEVGAGDWITPGVSVRSGGIVDGLRSSALEACVLGKDATPCTQETVRNRLGDYLVLGLDFKLFEERALVRLFTILDLTGYRLSTFDPELGERVTHSYSPFSEEGFSAVLYPEVAYTFGGGLTLGAGALVQLGRTYTKFGDPAAGGSLVFVHGRYAF